MEQSVRNVTGTNPILKMDYPDPDVINVNGTYYMISTTMHYMPGAEILISYDLINWEHLTYVYDALDSTPAQRLENGEYIYGKGMWAATIRYHEGEFYVIFVCNDTHKTYLYRATDPCGEWKKSIIDGFYHDASLLFDDGKAYLVYGNRDIYLTQLKQDLTGPEEGGLHRLIVSDAGNPSLGYEGSHIYKIFDRYYLFLIHSRRDRWRRVEACFSSDSLEGEFTGGDVFDDDLGFRDSGIAQGGIVEGPQGTWNSIMFRDNGAVGRIPVVVPVRWEKDTEGIPRPVFGTDGKAPETLTLASLKPGHEYAPLTGNDDFRYDPSEEYVRDRKGHGTYGFRSFWQFNHEPGSSLVGTDAVKGRLFIRTDRTVTNIFHAKNTLTQRMTFPSSSAEVTLDGSDLNDGDHAGLAAFQGDYLTVGLCRKDGRLYAEFTAYTNDTGDVWKIGEGPAQKTEIVPIEGNELRVRLTAVFNDETGDRDTAFCEIYENGSFRRFGDEQPLRFRLDHFTGCRFGLFMMSGEKTGGTAYFSEFVKV